MDIKALKFDEDCMLALTELQQTLAEKEDITMQPTKSMKELVDMMEVCLRSSSTEVNFSLLTFIALLTDRQRAFFKSVGTDFSLAKKISIKEKMINYRGAKLGVKVVSPPKGVRHQAHTPESHEGKKRIIYRGQEKWV